MGLSIVNLVLGTDSGIAGRKVLMTGANGAYGSVMKTRLEALGAEVATAKSGVDFTPGHYEPMREKLQWADLLVLAHGSRTLDCWNANYTTFVDLIETFVAIGRDRPSPPEVWAIGCEAEIFARAGKPQVQDYAKSKRAFMARSRGFNRSSKLIYRHIVPSNFTSSGGRGLMSAETAVAVSLFFLRRGFAYVPVTYTTLALWNYLPFRFGPTKDPQQPAE